MHHHIELEFVQSLQRSETYSNLVNFSLSSTLGTYRVAYDAGAKCGEASESWTCLVFRLRLFLRSVLFGAKFSEHLRIVSWGFLSTSTLP